LLHPDAALHGHVAVETNVAQRLEGTGEVRVTGARLEAIAVGEVDVGEVPTRVTYRLPQLVLLDVHVEEVAHDLQGAPTHGVAQLDRVLEAVEHVVLVAVERLQQQEGFPSIGPIPRTGVPSARSTESISRHSRPAAR
jgi:hypothetical protein